MTVHAAVTPAIPLIANLARTGSDLLPAGALAALFALAGAGILLLRRRAARR
jgi:LPXTG-motif cell wall-anchored protein